MIWRSRDFGVRLGIGAVCLALAGLVTLVAAPSHTRGGSTATGDLSGAVTDGVGPLPGAQVTLAIGAGHRPVAKAVTDTDGRYAFRQVPPATYAVTVELTGFTAFSKADVVIGANARVEVNATLAVTGPSETTILYAQVEPGQAAATGQVIGTVTDASRGVIPGATVALSGSAIAQPRTTTTDSKGSYQFRDVPPGTYGLFFGMRGFRDFMKGDVVVKDGNVVQVMAQLDVGVDHDLCGGSSVVASAPGDSRALHYGETRVGLKTELGDIEIVVEGEQAPITTQNFLKYVSAHLYDGGDFHRTTRPDNYTMLLPNRPMMRIIQGGINPARRSESFPPIALERTSVTRITHQCGTVSMARGAADTATSDFFICLDDQPSLDFGGKRFDDGQGAAAFGFVVKGIDVVEKINTQPAQGQNLTPPIKILSASVLK